VTRDNGKSFCSYDGPTPESIRGAAEPNGPPVDSIVEVSVLDPCFYHPLARLAVTRPGTAPAVDPG
jgi:hypothetical protein